MPTQCFTRRRKKWTHFQKCGLWSSLSYRLQFETFVEWWFELVAVFNGGFCTVGLIAWNLTPAWSMWECKFCWWDFWIRLWVKIKIKVAATKKLHRQFCVIMVVHLAWNFNHRPNSMHGIDGVNNIALSKCVGTVFHLGDTQNWKG